MSIGNEDLNQALLLLTWEAVLLTREALLLTSIGEAALVLVTSVGGPALVRSVRDADW